MNKRIISMFLALAMVFALAGCKKESPASQSSSQVVSTSNKDVRLLFWVYPKWSGVYGTEKGGQAGDWEKAMAAKFMQMHPNVHIEVQLLDFNSGPEKVSIALANKQAANVLHDSESRMFSYANDGFLVPISDYLTDKEKAEYYDGALATSAIADGKSYY